jgi:hypothetical protein
MLHFPFLLKTVFACLSVRDHKPVYQTTLYPHMRKIANNMDFSARPDVNPGRQGLYFQLVRDILKTIKRKGEYKNAKIWCKHLQHKPQDHERGMDRHAGNQMAG